MAFNYYRRSSDKPRNLEEDYVFNFRNVEYHLRGHYKNEPSSPDGLRWIAHESSKPVLNRIVRELAEGMCEMKCSPRCWKKVPLGAGTHHVVHKKSGGAFTDDRIWRNGERIRILACPSCHKNHHNKLHWTMRQSEEASEKSA